MKTHHILVPVDFSEPSTAILETAEAFIKEFGSIIHLMHVVPVTRYFSESFAHVGYPFDMEKEIYPKALDNAHNKLEELAEKYIIKGNRGEIITVIDRSPANAIIEQSKKTKFDLIMMATRGSHGSEFLRGSVTEKVIRKSEIPVLSMEKPFKIGELDNIMVPLDLSKTSFVSVPVAFQLANRFKSNITFFHSIELYTADVEIAPLMPPVNSEEAVRNALLSRTHDYFNKYSELGLELVRNDEKEEYAIKGEIAGKKAEVKVAVKITRGFSANRDIVDYANEHADMVIMSTHGHTGLARLLLGSSTERVSQHVTAPLLTVRPPKE